MPELSLLPKVAILGAEQTPSGISLHVVIQCTVYKLIQFYSSLGTILRQINVPASLYGISTNNSKNGLTFNV